MAEESLLHSIHKQIEDIRKTLGDLKEIGDQINKPRVVVCSVVNVTDQTLWPDFSHHESGSFVQPPTRPIPPSGGDTFISATAGGGLFTGTVGSQHFKSPSGLLMMCDWNNPWAGDNSSSVVLSNDFGRYRAMSITGGQDKAVTHYAIYSVPEQPDWSFCPKCSLLFYGPYISRSLCPRDSRHHEHEGYNFVLGHGLPGDGSLSERWKFCDRCCSLFYDGIIDNKGICPSGGSHIAGRGSHDYLLPSSRPAPWHPSQQPGWHHCGKCGALYFHHHAEAGRCIKTGDRHVGSGYNYVLPHNIAPHEHQQGGWHCCRYCNGLFFNHSDGGVCPARTTGHRPEAELPEYVIPHSIGDDHQNQSYWRFCRRCAQMFYDGDATNKGACVKADSGVPLPGGHGPGPANPMLRNAAHEAQGHVFVLPHDTPADESRQQSDWRFCHHCYSLFFLGVERGACAAGGGHVSSGQHFLMNHLL